MIGRADGLFFHSNKASTWFKCGCGLHHYRTTVSGDDGVRLSNRRCRRIDGFCVFVWGSSLPELVNKEKGSKM